MIGRRQWLIRSTGVVLGISLARLLRADPLRAAPTVKPIRIKNGRTVRVVLGERRETAAGLRPDKGGWLVRLAPELAGSSVDLQDVTPGVSGSRWSLPLSGEMLVLDTDRFLPSHVYRADVRRGGQLLGSTLIYLYPLPVERVARVKFQEDETDHPSSSLTPMPKGELSRGAEARSLRRPEAPVPARP